MANATPPVYTEEKLGKLALKADTAAERKNWSRAIKYGERTFLASSFLYEKNDLRYITHHKNLNRYYDKAGRIREASEGIKEAYLLSKQHLDPKHNVSTINRLLYYKLLIKEQNYADAIPIVLENIALLSSNKEDSFRLYHYLKQLYSLYAFTGNLEKEEQTLIKFLNLDKWLVDSNRQENLNVIIQLAKNYCKQDKIEEFNALVASHKLDYFCK